MSAFEKLVMITGYPAIKALKIELFYSFINLIIECRTIRH